jgi:hypothetical protein
VKSVRALAVLALAAASCARPVPEPRFLNLDPESTAGALGPGWSGFEKTDRGDTFAWAQAREAEVRLVAPGAADRLVRFRAWPFEWEGAPPQTVSVSVNGTKFATVTLSPGPAVYSGVAPAAAWKEGANTLAFEFAWAEAPKDRVPAADDTRTLAAAFDWIEVLPVRPEGSRQP